MIKWFDINYYYLVFELQVGQGFVLCGDKLLVEYCEVCVLGIQMWLVLLGLVSFLLLFKIVDGSLVLDLLDVLLLVYVELFGVLKDVGVEWVQLDELLLVQDLDEMVCVVYVYVYVMLVIVLCLKVLLVIYFGVLDDNFLLVVFLFVDGLYVDLVCVLEQLDVVIKVFLVGCVLLVGLVNGCNIWCIYLDNVLVLVCYVYGYLGNWLWLFLLCLLLYSLVDFVLEIRFDDELCGWLVFV